MNLALVLGKSSESIKSKLKFIKDDLSISGYVSIAECVEDATRKNIQFDRFLIVSTVLRGNDISILYDYWCSWNKMIEIVVLCKKPEDDEYAESLKAKFYSSRIVAMSVSSTTLQTIKECVTTPIKELYNKYVVANNFKVEVENDISIDEENSAVSVESASKKTSFFKKLLGGKKNKELNSKSNIENETRTSEVSNEYNQNNNPPENVPLQEEYLNVGLDKSMEGCSEYIKEEQLHAISEGDIPLELVENIDVSCELSNGGSSESTETTILEEGNKDKSEVANKDCNLNNNLISNTDIESVMEGNDCTTVRENLPDSNISNPVYANSTDIEEDTEAIENSSFTESLLESSESNGNLNLDNPASSTEQVEVVGSSELSSDEYLEHTNIDTVSDEFDDLSLSEVVTTSNDTTISTQSNSETVDEVEVDLAVGSAEEEYRNVSEKPKVIRETVVKEVIKTVGNTMEDAINKGMLHKIILVTGDRSSGVTTLAWSLARHFCKKTPVLYYDCDTTRHGLLDYVDYHNYKKYGDAAHLEGTRIISNPRVFNSGICRWDTNLNIITSDYGVTTSDDELKKSQGSVVENMHNFGLVVVDCPLENLHNLQDIILAGNVVVCMEDGKRGCMNLLLELDKSPLPLRYKRNIVSKGTLVRTKISDDNDFIKLKKYINDIVELDDCDWFSMLTLAYTGTLTKDFIEEILRG